jgi:diguanylate cyclase (GGDEF)-like protein
VRNAHLLPSWTRSARTAGAELEQKLLPPVMVAGVLAVVTLFACLIFLTWKADGLAQQRDESLAATALNSWTAKVASGMIAEAAWDDTVAHVQNRFDPSWVQRNLNAWYNHHFGLERLLIIDGTDRVVFEGLEGEIARPGTLADYRIASRGLVAKVRRLEKASGPLARPNGVRRVSKSIQASGFETIDGRSQYMTATLIEPDFGTVLPNRPGPAPIMIGAKEFDANSIARIAHALEITNARLVDGRVRHSWLTDATLVPDVEGRPIATLVWEARRPGSAIAVDALPAVLFIALVVLFGGALLIRRTRELTRGLVASQAHALHVALHDAFTGLANRALFEDRLGQALERRRRFDGSVGVFVIDLDRFKQVNDSLGHASGDQLIQEAARRIRHVCRNTDTVARLGGDEFAVVQSDAASPHDVEVLAERLNDALSGPIELIGGSAEISASIGVAVIETSEIEPTEALRRADLALYRAKDQGRGRHILFAGEMDESARMRQQLATELAAALDKDLLEVAYQPQVTPRGRRIDAVEALVRWRHPKLGAISPAIFIPIAEEGELIDRIGLYVLERACADSLRWPGVVTSVNLSAAQLRRDGLVEAYIRMVRDHGCDAAMIELEITESVMLEHTERNTRALARLKEAGFRLALDDFGAGHTSLGHLRRYPLDKIKIDRSYISALGSGGGDEAMVIAIVRLARALGMEVTAEGVETRAQLDVLSRAGVSLVQGFLFSKAVKADEIERMLSADGGRIAA